MIDERIESMNTKGRRSITEVVDAYIDYLATKNGSSKYRRRVRSYVMEFVTAGSWSQLREIDAESVTKRAANLLAGSMAPRTVNARLTAIKGFTRWLVPDNLHFDPLAGVKKPDPRIERRLERRMLLPDEWPWLFDAADSGVDNGGLTGPDRATLYMLAVQTGLRVNEIAGLKRGKVILTGKTPHEAIRCQLACT